MTTPRECPICTCTDNEIIYRQRFSEFSEGGLFNGYDVVSCKHCGFGFASDIPDQSKFDEYYKLMSKYENEHLSGQVSQSALSTYRAIVETVKSVLADKSARILDVGCATGALLAEFKDGGFQNVIGSDPSPSCAQTAMRLYDIQVLTNPISEINNFEVPFDFLILNSVLEHICDVNASLQSLRSLLKSGGMIWIEVPDTTRFSDWTTVAFQQFSMEHINFFSATSLTNLMQKNGFEPVLIGHNKRQLEEIIDPALSTIFRKSEKVSNNFTPKHDDETRPALLDYIERSYQADSSVLTKIQAVVESGRAILVWGVGTHTQRLLATSLLAKAKIIAFVDSNSRYYDKKLEGIPILPPQQLNGTTAPILISSRLYQEEIAHQIQHEFNLPNEIIRLY
jgi:2-polyprenyl-3-methyl-5-hydroxy-6-metoxy-1,4-benzoquinol methylase